LTSDMEVFELEFSVDDFTTLYLPDKNDEQLFRGEIESRLVSCQSVRDIWRDFVVLPEEVRKQADFFELSDSSAIILSSRAISTFSPILDSKDVELLPLASDDQIYYLLNMTAYTQKAINVEKSTLELLPSNIITSFESLFFNRTAVESKYIFVTPELPYRIFITDRFRELYIANNLAGLELSHNSSPIWYDFNQ